MVFVRKLLPRKKVKLLITLSGNSNLRDTLSDVYIQKQSHGGGLKKSVLKISQNSHQNTCARVAF